MDSVCWFCLLESLPVGLHPLFMVRSCLSAPLSCSPTCSDTEVPSCCLQAETSPPPGAPWGVCAIALMPKEQQDRAGCSPGMLEATMDKASAGSGAESQSSEQTPACGAQQDHPKHFFLTVGQVLSLHPFPLNSHPVSFSW